MRAYVTVSLMLAACGSVPDSGPHYDSVRDRLSRVSTPLYVHDEASGGTVTARRGDRVETTNLAIQHGYISASLDDDGRLAIAQLQLAVAPISTQLASGQPARLEDVGVRLVRPTRGDTTWSSDDEATVTLGLELDIGGAIALDGGTPSPLATQRLQPMRVALSLAGTGDHVEASIDVDALGDLWTWGEVTVTEVALSLAAETAD